jgi:hypothetical protein
MSGVPHLERHGLAPMNEPERALWVTKQPVYPAANAASASQQYGIFPLFRLRLELRYATQGRVGAQIHALQKQ